MARRNRLAAEMRFADTARRLEIATTALRGFGVCMSCLFGRGSDGNCHDCMNTGFEQGKSPAEVERLEILEAFEAFTTDVGRPAFLRIDTIRDIIKTREGK